MKNTLLFCTLFTAAMLSSCSSEEPIPMTDIGGRYEGYRAEMTFNGVAETAPVIDIVMEEGTTANSGMAKVTLNQRNFVVMDGHRLFSETDRKVCDYMPLPVEILAEANSYSDKITLSGEEVIVDQNGDLVRYILEGTYSKVQLGKAPVKLDVRTEIHSRSLTGKTFEMRFDEDILEAYGHVFENQALPNTGLLPLDAFKEFCTLLPANYIAKTGFDALRFTFNEDGSIDVLAHDIETGNYIRQETRSSYQPGNWGRIFFIQDADWTKKTIAQFSPYSTSSEFSLPRGFYEFRLANLGAADLGVMSALIQFENGNLKICPRLGLIHNPLVADRSWVFISSWPIKSGYTEEVPGKALFDDVMYAIHEKWMECDVNFIAHPVLK